MIGTTFNKSRVMVQMQVIARGIDELQRFFNHKLNPTQLEHYLSQLPQWFDCDWDWDVAVKSCMQKCRFFPAPQELIDAANGTVEERALWEWDDHDLLSKVGRKALNSIGGIYAVQNSENPSRLKSDFIKAYVAFAKGAKPSDFKPCPLALPPPREDKPAPGTPVKPIFVLGDTDVNKMLGIVYDGKRPYTEWEILLHRWWSACQFGTVSQQQKYRQLAQEYGRELPTIVPLDWKGNLKPTAKTTFVH